MIAPRVGALTVPGTRAAKRRRLARMRRITALLSAASLACVLAACGGGGDDDGTGSAAATSPPATAAAVTGTVPEPTDIEAAGATRVPDLGEPDWLMLAGGSAWAAGVDKGVGRLDGTTGALVGSVVVTGEICLAMDVGFESLWAASCRPTPSLTRIDPSTGKVTATIPLPSDDLASESSLAVTDTAVWVLTTDRKLIKVDPETNAVAGTFETVPGAAALRGGFGSLWITDANEGALLRVDPADASVKQTIPIPEGTGARFLAVGDDAVWVLVPGGTVARIDPATNAVAAVIPVDSGRIDGGDIAVGGGAVWARVTSSLVVRIDPATNAATVAYGPASGSGSVAADDDALWVSAHDVSAVWRLPAQ